MDGNRPRAEGKRPVVCIQGLGFVGAAMAIAVADARDASGHCVFDVIGVDLPTPLGSERIDAVNSGTFPFVTLDEDLPSAAARAHREGNLTATADAGAFEQADIVIVDVHLDVDTSSGTPTARFATLRGAIRTIAARIRPGTLVIVETTVPPGTCEKIVAVELTAGFEARGLKGNDFLLAHSYERVMPGRDYLASIKNFWRVYAGLDERSARACEAFLSKVINVAKYPLTRVHPIAASEMAKIMENSYRATNIAFIEEWARFAEGIGVNLFEVVDAIRARPTHNNIRQPGFGVGGYCLTKDPLFAGIAARELYDRSDLRFPFSERAVAVNAQMPLVTVDLLEQALGGDLRGKAVLLMGIAYRPDVADTRYSPSETFRGAVEARGAKVVAHDPLVRHWEEAGLDVSPDLPRASSVDAVVLAVPHSAYELLDFNSWLAGAHPVFVDANNVLTPAQRNAIELAGCVLRSVGRG